MHRRLAALLFLLGPAALAAQPVVSPGPEAVSVTVYRGQSGEFDLDWLEGYALITETRTIDLPQGPSEIRFEGVAGGIIPVSTIVSGLSEPVVEKNRDARLISAGGLIDSTLGKRVHIRRTSRATGKVTETEAVLRSGPNGVILQTPEGIEALRCGGLPETLVYDGLPEALSDKPTLAIQTNAATATRATLRLSYLATGFDWRASYVIGLAPDGRTLDLFAWLTLANSNDESFVAAQTQAVAGSPNKEEEEELGESSVPEAIHLQCWPSGTTSDLPFVPRPVAPPPAEYEMDGEEIVITGRQIRGMAPAASMVSMVAVQEELGDLKLYRIPEPVTVAAHAQKQVAMLVKSKVQFDRLYGASVNARGDLNPQPVPFLLRIKNETKNGLGVPLPSGSATVFETVEGRSMMAGEIGVEDTAVGQLLELRVGESPQVMIAQRAREEMDGKDAKANARAQHFEVSITNANPHPVVVETLLHVFGENVRLVRPTRKLDRRNGRHMWRAKVPAEGRATLVYAMERIEPRDVEDED